MGSLMVKLIHINILMYNKSEDTKLAMFSVAKKSSSYFCYRLNQIKPNTKPDFFSSNSYIALKLSFKNIDNIFTKKELSGRVILI